MKKEINGLENFSKIEKFKLNRLINTRMKKILKKLGEIREYKIIFKNYSETGKRKITSIHLEITPKNRKFSADSQGWNSTQVVKDCFEKIIAQLEKEYNLIDEKRNNKRQ